MADLIDLSLVIIALAVIGFIFKEVFYFHRKFCTPYDDNNSGDNTFGYISTAVLIIGTCWVLIIFSGVSNPESFNSFLKPFLEGLQKFVDLGFISETDIMAYIAKVVLVLFVFTWLSILFVYALFVTLILGIISIFIDKKAIQVEFVDTSTSSKQYKRIIKETDYFFYFETLDDFRNWESVRKTEVSSIKSIVTKSKIERKLQKNMPDFILKHSIIGNERKRNIITVIFLLLALAFAVLAGVTEYGLIKILLIIFCVPALFLTIIDSAMREGED
jgi:hypothetical protein